MLTAEGIGYRVGAKWLVNNVSLSVESGEFVAIVGANGAGKTTLLRLLSGELRPDTGRIELQGKSQLAYTLRELALLRSVMRQHVELNFDFTAEEVVMMGRHPHTHGTSSQRDKAIVNTVLQQTETTDLRKRLYATLSAGEKARVTLARILAQQTPFVMMDEPTSTMDLRHQQLTMHIARRLVEEGGTVIAILHDLNLAALYADRVGMMIKGELYALGTPEEVFTIDNIARVFDIAVHIIAHPDADVPLIVPLHREDASKFIE
jgi:iron complex transport system ATP-binding protein